MLQCCSKRVWLSIGPFCCLSQLLSMVRSTDSTATGKMGMKRALKKSKKNFPNCRHFKTCGRKAKSLRATLCESCFKAHAARSGAQSGGNGKAKGQEANKGNTKNHDGIAKKRAGKRSVVKRSSKVALVVKKQWLDKILSGEKDWEIRSSNTSRRGWIHFAESGAGGRLLGRAQLVDCFELTKTEFTTQKIHHCVPRSSEMPYKRMYAWVLEKAQRFPKLFRFTHAKGAVIWVKV